jgi:26S proteasome regulatory subunit N3
MADVDMKPADKPTDSKDAETTKSQPAPPLTPAAEIKSNLALIHRGVSTLEPRFTNRVLRTLTTLKKKLNAAILRSVIEEVYAKGTPSHFTFAHVVERRTDAATKGSLLALVPNGASVESSGMDVDSAPPPAGAKPAPTLELVPESEVYIRLLIILQLLKQKETYGKAKDLAKETVEKIASLNRRSMDPLAAKVWYSLERAYELNGVLAEARP